MSKVIQPTLEECRRFGLKRGDRIGGHEVLPPIAGASDLRLVDGMDYENAGQSTSTSLGTTVTANASANTKGSWSQLVASTARDASGIIVAVTPVSSSSVPILVDIGIGASGSEQILIPNLLQLVSNNVVWLPALPCLPISIPAGSRLSARCQSSTPIATCSVSAILVEEGFASPSGFSRMTDYGTVTALTTGTAVTSGGSTNTKGSWTQLVASTTNPSSSLLICWFPAGSTTSSQQGSLLDIGIGAAASEQVVLGNLPAGGQASSSVAPNSIGSWCLVPLVIPAGTRIAARTQYNVSASQISRVIVYGID